MPDFQEHKGTRKTNLYMCVFSIKCFTMANEEGLVRIYGKPNSTNQYFFKQVQSEHSYIRFNSYSITM